MEKAVIQTGGKQYLVHKGQLLRVETIHGEPGAQIEFSDLLGSKLIHATIVEHGRGPKIHILKFRPKVRYLKRKGHRQGFTAIRIEEIK